jgi:predicted methyltransferase
LRHRRSVVAFPVLLLAGSLAFPCLSCAGPKPAAESRPLPAPAAAPAVPAAPAIESPPARQPAEVLSFHSADWLERPERESLEHPDVVLAAMDLKPGQVVAEIGAGTGFFSRRIAKIVGPSGKVLANDIQPEMLELLRGYARKEGVSNIVPTLGTEVDPKLPSGGVDRVLLVDVYHEFQKPQEMLAKIRDSLAPGGTVTLVEYRGEGDSAAHISALHRMTEKQVLDEWLPAGFLLLDQVETLPSQHVFVFSGKRGARPR